MFGMDLPFSLTCKTFNEKGADKCINPLTTTHCIGTKFGTLDASALINDAVRPVGPIHIINLGHFGEATEDESYWSISIQRDPNFRTFSV